MPDRILRCPYPGCSVELPLADDKNYQSDYNAIAKHSSEHDPPVIGAWLETDVRL